MDVLKGKELIRADGVTKSPSETALKDKKVVVLYFSAHWCPPCRLFTPLLKECYKEASALGVEVVFVSSDRSPKDMLEYMRESHGEWWGVEHGSEEAQALKQKYSIAAVPTVVVLKAEDGSVITREGRADVQGKGAKAAREWIEKC